MFERNFARTATTESRDLVSGAGDDAAWYQLPKRKLELVPQMLVGDLVVKQHLGALDL